MKPINAVFVVAWKELLDLSRDPRSLTNVFVMGALLGPVLAILLLSFSQRLLQEEVNKTLEIPAIGIAYAPELVRHLEQQDIKLIESEDLRTRVAEQTDEVAVRITEDFVARIQAGKPVVIDVLYDEVRTKSNVQKRRIELAINSYAGRIGSQRLLARGIDPSITQPAMVREIDVSTGTSGGAARMLALLPYLLIIGLIQASMFIASDVTAGERERQSLEPLLINPVPPGYIMGGKLLINILTCIAVVTVSAVAFIAGTMTLSVEDMGLIIDPMVIPYVLFALLPLVFVIAPLMTFLGAFAKSVREAQTYLSIVILIAILPSMAQMMLQARVAGLQLLIPLWSQNYIVNEIFRGAEVSIEAWLYSITGSLLLGGVFMVVALLQYQRPKLIFND